MPYIQQNTPPPNKIMNFSLKNFVGGLNNRSEILEPNQCSDVINMTFADDTVMEKRKGTTFFDTLLMTSPVVFIDEFKPYAGVDILLRATESELYLGDTKLCDLSGQMTGLNFLGKYFFSDGQQIRVYGQFPQETTDYIQIVGTPDPNFRLMQVVNPPQGYIALGTEHLKGRTIYNYTANQVWYEPCANELDDVYKGSSLLPEKPRYLVSHNGRLFASGSERDDDTVFIGEIHNPFYFPVATSMQLPPNSDRVVGMHVFDGALVVGRRHDIYAIHGQTNRPGLGVPVFSLQRVNSHTGWTNHYAVDIAHNSLFFLGADGNAYALSGANVTDENIASSILTKTVDLFKAPLDFTRPDLFMARTLFKDDKWYMTIKDKILVYSYRLQAWSIYGNIKARCFYDYNDVLIWGDDNGRVAMPSEDYLDHGVPFQAFWQSGSFDMDEANSYKQFREFFIVAHTFEDFKSDVYVTFEVDYADVKNAAVIANQISIWGKSKFGDRFITRNINASVPFVIGRRGRNLRFRFTNGFLIEPPVADLNALATYVNPKFDRMVYVTAEEAYYVFLSGDWVRLELEDLNQPMRVYQINGEYELRGKR